MKHRRFVFLLLSVIVYLVLASPVTAGEITGSESAHTLDPTPVITTPQFKYEFGETAEVTISGLWPNSCIPEPNNAEYVDNPNPPDHLPIVLNFGTRPFPSVQIELIELLNRRQEYFEAKRQGIAEEWYSQNCGGGETEWSYTFASDSLDIGWYGVYFWLTWKLENPLNDDPQWTCDPNRYCILDEDTYEHVFHVGESIYLPAVEYHIPSRPNLAE